MRVDGGDDLDDDDEDKQLRELLLGWYVREHRKLPWRAEPYARGGIGTDPGAPYAVWVSEVMLQQTQVATVVRYFERWMQELPTVEALGAATRERVNELWAGLGYYRRARMLHEGAQVVIEQFDGRLPSTVEELRTIPGIGAYTAGAIASIAFNRPEPLVDGNVARVLSRLFDVEEVPSSPVFWTLARRVLDRERPAEFNQALMELGATLCTPKRPQCGACPVAELCAARRAAIDGGHDADAYVTRLPKRAKRTAQREESVAVCVVEALGGSGELLMVQRPEGGLLPGLWEFPTSAVEAVAEGRSAKAAERRLVREAVASLGEVETAGAAQPRYVGEVRHVFTHIKQTLRVYHLAAPRAAAGGGSPTPPRHWTSPDKIKDMAVSAQMRKVLSCYRAWKKGALDAYFPPE